MNSHLSMRLKFDAISKHSLTVLGTVWTADMIGDFGTKPVQGALLFKKFRDQIMGVIPAQDPGPGKASKSDKAKGKPTKGKK
jgi:hypothetical protein